MNLAFSAVGTPLVNTKQASAEDIGGALDRFSVVGTMLSIERTLTLEST